MSQIADIMEISQPRVSQLHAQAISKLKKHMKA
jgi:RNA polymerase sigma factor for flagellar operon FliA